MAQDRIRSVSVTVGTDSLRIAESLEPTQRKEIYVCNTSSNGAVITLGIGGLAVSGSGLVLYPGGSYSSSADGYNFFPLEQDFNAISNIAGGTLSVFERIGSQVTK